MVESASGFSSETQCTFDLKFGRDDNELIGSVGDLFSSSQTPVHCSDDFGDQASLQDDRQTRKRKLDKEGFVTPATPDIHKSSLQSGHEDFMEGKTGDDVNNDDTDDNFSLTQQQQNHQPEQQQPQRKKPHKLHKRPGTDEASNIDNTNSSSQQPAEKIYELAADLFEDVAQGTKMLIIQMAQNFRESEEYESVCLANVESLLIEAKEMEDSLRQQKEILQQRIFMIGQRLSTQNQ